MHDALLIMDPLREFVYRDVRGEHPEEVIPALLPGTRDEDLEYMHKMYGVRLRFTRDLTRTTASGP